MKRRYPPLAVAAITTLNLIACVAPAPGGPTRSGMPTPPSSSVLTAEPTRSPTVTEIASSPLPTDADFAVELGNRYESYLTHLEWERAWGLLAPESVEGMAYTEFVASGIEDYTHTEGVYVASSPRHDLDELGQWVADYNSSSIPGHVRSAQLNRAFLISYSYPKVYEWCRENHPDEVGCGTHPADELLVAPDATETWRVWWRGG